MEDCIPWPKPMPLAIPPTPPVNAWAAVFATLDSTLYPIPAGLFTNSIWEALAEGNMYWSMGWFHGWDS